MKMSLLKTSQLKKSLFSLALGLASLISGAVQAETIEEIEARVQARIDSKTRFSKEEERSFARDLAMLYADSLNKRAELLKGLRSLTDEEYDKLKELLRTCNNKIECLQEFHAPLVIPKWFKYRGAVAVGSFMVVGFALYMQSKAITHEKINLKSFLLWLFPMLPSAMVFYGVVHDITNNRPESKPEEVDSFKKRIMKEVLRVLPDFIEMPSSHQELWLRSKLLPIDIPLSFFSDENELAKGYGHYKDWLNALIEKLDGTNATMHTQLQQLLDAAGRPGFLHKTKLERLLKGIAQVHRFVDENNVKSLLRERLYGTFDDYIDPSSLVQDGVIREGELLKRRLLLADDASEAYFTKNKKHFLSPKISLLLMAAAREGQKILFKARIKPRDVDNALSAKPGEDVLLSLEVVGRDSPLAKHAFYHVPGLKGQADVLTMNLDQLFATATDALSTTLPATSNSHDESLQEAKGSLGSKRCDDVLTDLGSQGGT